MHSTDLPPQLPATAAELEPAPKVTIWRRIARGVVSSLDWLFGLLSLVLGLAVLSIIPVANFLSLGYLIHASGRVAATGRLRNGFVGIRKASVVGSFFLGTWLVLLPVRLISGMWKDAELIAPGGATAGRWHVAVLVLTVLAVLHVVWACLRGGRVWHFAWPAPIRFFKWLSTPDKFEMIRNAVVDFCAGLRLPYYFWLGARGFFGAFAWLLIPVGFLILAAQMPPDKGGGFFSLVGGFLLMLVVLYLPFLQTHFALKNRFAALFAVGEVRRLFKRAPIAFWLSLFITLLFALPLYLLKIELPPREVAWLPSLLFVIFIFPARLLTGWAVGRANRRERPCHWFFRWTSRLALIPVVFFYVFFVYLTQYLSWNGSLSLLEQHAFMVPAPLMNL
ncbi:MAG TPA: hypothetical protein VN887_12550 [Candidatus Angelobacter sp.]|nr:hypothetical protein [Candidatus Angelobacter sp.]